MGIVLSPGTRVGPYVLLSEVGRGGMGVVHLAQGPDGRQVALKLLAAHRAHEERYRRRFEHEIRAGAALNDPHVVRVFDLGQHQGHLWLALEWLPGGSLERLVRERGRLPWRRAAELGAGIARGLAAIHAAGLVHRDLKPANVLLDGEGRPRIADFGLVAESDLGQGLTRTGELIGTLAYLAPEMAESSRVDGRADLYSLGCTLHCLLTGHPPFPGSGVELIAHHLGTPPPSARAEVPGLPPAFEALVLRLMDKDPARRGDAAGVARELDGLASATGRRRRLPVAAALLGAAVLCGGGLAATQLLERPELAPPAPSPPAPPPAQAPLLRLARQLGQPWRAHGECFGVAFLDEERAAVLDEHGWVRVLTVPGGAERSRFQTGAPGQAGTLAARGERILARTGQGRVLGMWTPDGQRVGQRDLGGREAWRLRVSPDGRWVAVVAVEPGGQRPGVVALFGGEDLTPRGELGAPEDIPRHLAFLPGDRLAVGYEGQGIRIWDLASRRALTELLPGERVRSLAAAPDGALLLAAPWGQDSGGTLREVPVWLLDPEGRSSPVVIGTTGATTIDAAIDPLGRRAITAAGFNLQRDGHAVRCWDLVRRAQAWPARGDPGVPRWHAWSAAISPSGRVALTGAGDGWRFWDMATGALPGQPAPAHRHRVTAVAPLPGGGLLSAGEDGSVLVRGPGGDVRQVATPDSGWPPNDPAVDYPWPVRSIALSPDGRQAALASTGRITRVELATLAVTVLDLGRWGRVVPESIDWSPDGLLVGLARDGGGAILRSGGDGQLVALREGERGRECVFAGFGAERDVVVVFRREVEVLRLPEGRVYRSVELTGPDATCAALSPAARSTLLFGDREGGVWALETSGSPTRPRRVGSLRSGAVGLAVSPAGDRALGVCLEEVVLFDLPGLVPIGSIDLRALGEGGDRGAAFSKDGRRAWVGTHAGVVLELEVER